MTEPIDPNLGPRNEVPGRPAELSPALWEGEQEIPRTLGHARQANAPASLHGWFALAVGLGSASVVLLLGSLAVWWSANPPIVVVRPATPPKAPVTNPNGPAENAEKESSAKQTLIRQSAVDRAQTASGSEAEPAARRGGGGPSAVAPPAVNDKWAGTKRPADDAAAMKAEKIAAAKAGFAPAFRRAINQVRLAWIDRDMPRAQRQLDRAKGLASSSAERERVAQFRALGGQLASFWDTVRAGLKTFEPGEELEIDGAIASVVEEGPTNLSLFIAGARRDYTLTNMPPKVALYCAQRGADKNAGTDSVGWGAVNAIDPQGDRELARRLWKSAQASGHPLDDMLPFLDPALMAIEREPVPDSASLNAAEEAVKAKYAQTIKTAKSAWQKSELAGRMMSAAAEVDSSVDQFTLLQQSAHWSSSAGEPKPALRAIDELTRWFEVDPWPLKSAALAGCAAASTKATAPQVVRCALESLTAAEVQGLVQQSESLATSAQTAARKSRDRELIQEVARRRRALDKSNPPDSPAEK